uniref:Uncharacterized protein n=1 Tax=Physcomitrium patens TaxID=3218 RepID=A0A7I4DCI5_PHYPA
MDNEVSACLLTNKFCLTGEKLEDTVDDYYGMKR